MIFLSLACGFQAYRARKLPGSFNEASLIAVAMFFSAIAYACMLAVYAGLSHDQTEHQMRVIATVLVMYSVNAAILVSMHGRRVHTILFRPYENNSRYFEKSLLEYNQKKAEHQSVRRSTKARNAKH